MSIELKTYKLREFGKALARIGSVKLAERKAALAASTITKLAHATFKKSQNAYGDDWELGVDGERVTLRRSGALAQLLVYRSEGVRLRCALGLLNYAPYQIFYRNVFPRQGSVLPRAYSDALARILVDEVKRVLRQ